MSSDEGLSFPANEERPGIPYSVTLPSDPTPTFEQPNGVTFEAYFWSAGVTAGWRTAEGYTVLKRSDGYWYYAISREGRLVPSDARVGIDQVPVRTPTALAPSAPTGGVQTATGKTNDGRPTDGTNIGIDTIPPTGTQNIPLVMINFSNTVTTYTPSGFQRLLFGDDPNIATGPGSVTDYYEETSGGQLTLTGNVSGWVTADNNELYYGSDGIGDGGAPTGAAELVKEAARKADDQVDFAQYDNDGDCHADLFSVTHQGAGQQETGLPADIWSHRWSLAAGTGSRYASADSSPSCPTIYVNGYTIQPEASSTGDMMTIGTYAHEFGHGLGLPDLYDTDFSSAGIGDWGLMAYGGDGAVDRSGDAPNHMTAWSKAYLGWLDPTEITTGEGRDGIILGNVSKNSDYLKLLNETNNANGEYFYVENRQKVGFDQGLPGEGLLITHINESRIEKGCFFVNNCNDKEDRKLVDVEAADGNEDMDNGNLNRGDAGDPWDEGASPFDDLSNPSSTYDNGTSSNATVSAIQFSDGTTRGTAMVNASVGTPTNFTVGINATNVPIVEGETLSVETIIENRGGAQDTQTITLDVGALGTNSTSVTLGEGASRNVSLSIPTSSGDVGNYTATISSEDDSDSTGVAVLAKANFTVGIDRSNSPVTAGNALNITATINNTGDGSGTQQINLSIDDSVVDSINETLNGGQSTHTTLQWPTSEGDTGTHTASVVSQNDSGSTSVTVLEPANVTVSIDSTNSPITEGETLNVTATVTNTGNETATQDIVLSLDGTQRDSTTVTLDGGNETTVAFSVGTAVGEADNYTATVASVVDADSTGVTVNMAANFTFQVGDVDRDGETDIVDVVRIQRHLARLDPGPFNPTLADVNRNSGISIVDAVLIQQELAQLRDRGSLNVSKISVNAPTDEVVVDLENVGGMGVLQEVEVRVAADESGLADPANTVGTRVVDLGRGNQDQIQFIVSGGFSAGDWIGVYSDDDQATTQV